MEYVVYRARITRNTALGYGRVYVVDIYHLRKVSKGWRWGALKLNAFGEYRTQSQLFAAHPQCTNCGKPALMGSVKWVQVRQFVAAVASFNDPVRAIFDMIEEGSNGRGEFGVLADALQEAGIPEAHPVLGALRTWGK